MAIDIYIAVCYYRDFSLYFRVFSPITQKNKGERPKWISDSNSEYIEKYIIKKQIYMILKDNNTIRNRLDTKSTGKK